MSYPDHHFQSHVQKNHPWCEWQRCFELGWSAKPKPTFIFPRQLPVHVCVKVLKFPLNFEGKALSNFILF